MKINSFNKLKGTFTILSVFCLMAMALLFSCEKDGGQTGDPFFTIEGDPTGLSATMTGITQSYTVHSNRPWKIVAQSEGDWVRAFPDEGDDDGIFKIIVNENATFNARTMNFAFIVDGEEQAVLFRVDQEGSVPYLTVKDVEAGINIIQAAQDIVINVKSNVEYTYTSDADWLTFTKAEAAGASFTDLTFSAATNDNADARVANVAFTCTEFPALNANMVITQEGKSEGTIVLYEDFNWLNYSTQIFYNTTGVVRYDNWTPEELAHGWTSTLNPGSGDTPLYGLIGCVKLGKTSYGGDIITPKIPEIVGTQDLVVKFKSVPYQTKAGTRDDNFLNLSLIGPGTLSQSQFIIDNWPTYPADAAEHEAYCAAFWNEPEAVRSFTITGATSETQVLFLGGDYLLSGVGAGKNRIFLDDITILIPN
ncbi:MAG: BACON domain-containing protein [Bacteroidales bacterium]|nr:BACON domain-containing protein [Bacteroidales bacterium]MCB8998768.1 BACON domain-containing protein [Bacteroidales bacterium]